MTWQPSASATATLLQCSRPFGEGVLVERGEASEAARYGSAWHECGAWALERWSAHWENSQSATKYKAVAAKHGAPTFRVSHKTSPKDKPWKAMPSLKELAGPLAKAAKRYDVGHSTMELEAHLGAALPKLFEWLEAIPHSSGDRLQIFVEKSFALNVATGEVREIANPTVDDHHYDTQPGEMAGTADLIVLVTGPKARHLYVVDHKTGEGDFSRPDRLPQIRTLALMATKALAPKGRGRLTAGVFHAFRRGFAKMYTDDLSIQDLREHLGALRQAFSRISDGTMRVGPLCKNCPARVGCPAGDSDLLVKAEALIKRGNVLGAQLFLPANNQANLTQDEKLGLLYETIKNGEELAQRARDAIKKEMEEGALPVLSNGKVLTLQKRTVERLSKREFVAAYGKLQAERLFAKWRKDEALIAKPEVYILPVDD